MTLDRTVQAFACALLATALPTPAVMAQDAEEAPAPASQAEPQRLPDAASLFERHAEAVGGREAYDAHDTRLMVGSLRSTEGMAAFVEFYFEKPDRLAIKLDVPGAGTLDTVYDGEIAWRAREGRYEIIEGDERRDLIESADFFGEVNWKQRYRGIRTVETGRLRGQPVFRVAYESTLGKRGSHFFDGETGLFVGTQTTASMGGTDQGIFVRFDDYEEHDGILLPTTLIQELPNNVVSTFSFNRIEHGADLSERLERPAEVTAILEAGEIETD